MRSKWITVIVILLIASFCLAVPGWTKETPRRKHSSPCTGPTIIVGTVSACASGSSVEVPITINDTAGQLNCTFSVSFDKTKLQYTGKTLGNMGASLLVARTSDINAAGIVQPIVTFEEGGPTAGTICTFKFTLLSAISDGSQVDLTIGDINAAVSFCGESGAVQCGTSVPDTWEDVVDIYEAYTKGLVTWEEVIAAYQAYVNQHN
jgi:hypothetical protein